MKLYTLAACSICLLMFNTVSLAGSSDIDPQASCSVHKKYIPFTDIGTITGADCLITLDSASTKIAAKVGGTVVIAAICAVVTIETDEILEPICELILEAGYSAFVEPAITGCADMNRGTDIHLSLDVVPPSGDVNAYCD